jgi:hypothetical protein
MLRFEKAIYCGASAYFCTNGHGFTWPKGKGPIPEGRPCGCGKTLSHWEDCSNCHQHQLMAVSLKPSGPTEVVFSSFLNNTNKEFREWWDAKQLKKEGTDGK